MVAATVVVVVVCVCVWGLGNGAIAPACGARLSPRRHHGGITSASRRHHGGITAGTCRPDVGELLAEGLSGDNEGAVGRLDAGGAVLEELDEDRLEHVHLTRA